MTPINAAVFKFVCASPVGKAMSDADRDALRSTLETTDVRDVRGWLGEQVRKAAAAAVAKGDYEGHPFRGNQYADASGASTGGAGSTPKPRVKGDAGMATGRGNKFRSRSDNDLRDDADELAASIEELQGLGEIENDRGDTDRAKATLAEAKSRMKELKAMRVELERRARGPQDSDSSNAKNPVNEALDSFLETTRRSPIGEPLKGSELKSLKSKTSALDKVVDRSSGVTSELGQRLKDLQSKIGETPAGSEARRTGIALLRDASAAVKEAKGHLGDFGKLLQRTKDDPSLGNAVRLETRGVDLGEMFKGAAREAERAMDKFETVLKFPKSPYMRSTSQISDRRGKAKNDKFTNDTAAIQGAAEKPVTGISGKRRDDAFDAVLEEDGN